MSPSGRHVPTILAENYNIGPAGSAINAAARASVPTNDRHLW
jgi:hypothetical protein